MSEMPVAGVVWQVLHYLEGLRRLGHDVTYIEDTGSWPYDPELDTISDDAAPAAAWLGRILGGAGFAGRWALISAAHPDTFWGMTVERIAEVVERADVLINLSGHTILKETHLQVPSNLFSFFASSLSSATVREAATARVRSSTRTLTPICRIAFTSFELPGVHHWMAQAYF